MIFARFHNKRTWHIVREMVESDTPAGSVQTICGEPSIGDPSRPVEIITDSAAGVRTPPFKPAYVCSRCSDQQWIDRTQGTKP